MFVSENSVIKKLTNNASRLVCNISIMILALLLSGCGGGGGGSAPGNTGGTGDNSSSYTVSVLTSGLSGSGLTVGISSDNGIETMSITSNGTRSFQLTLAEGSLYTVGIGSQPTGQSCSIGGNFFDTNVTSDASVTVTCVSTLSIGGSITGLTGDVELTLNGTNWTTFSANGNFIFDKQLADGDYYAVAVDTHPVGQTCLLANSGGQLSGSHITDIAVSCSDSVAGYKVGGYVSGLYGAITLKLNGAEEISTTINGPFQFSSSLASNSTYSVTVASAPVGYKCLVKNGSGTIASSDYPFVDIDCVTSSTAIKPKVDPYNAWLDSGQSITVTLNGVTDLTLDDWDFNPVSFSSGLNPGDSYEVTIKTLPTGRSCLLYNSVGVIEAGVIPTISIRCVNDTSMSYSIGGTITGLTGSGLVLGLDGRNSLAIAAASTSYTFPDDQLDSTPHYISVLTQPAGQICTILNSNPWISGRGVTDANIICSTGPYSIGGSAIGVAAAGLSLKLNNAEALSLPAGGAFEFNTLLSDGMSYEVTIASQPTDHVCTVNNGEGWNLSEFISNILIECQAADYSVATNVKGYGSSTPLLLQLNGDEIIEATYNTINGWYPYPFNPIKFDTRLQTGDLYSVSIVGHPAGQLCALSNNSGVIGTNDIGDIGAVCVTQGTSTGPYSVSVTTSGVVGSGLVLQLNGADDLTVTADGYESFSGLLADSSAYTVSVLTQPSAPMQHCTVVNGSGTISANVTNVSVQCGNAVKNRYPVNGAKWLDYLKNDGANTYSANDIACDTTVDTGGYDACLNGGEYRSLLLPAALSSCANITAVDSLNAFNWVCDDSSGVRIVSTGLKAGVGLTDLIDFTDVSFKPIFVSVYDSGVYVDATQPAVWWSNPVKVNNTGKTIYSGEIHLVNAAVTDSITMNNNSAVLIQSGSSYAGSVSARDKSYLWFEGDISGSIESGIYISSTSFSVVQNAQLLYNANYGLYLSGDNNKLSNIVANQNGIQINYHGIEVNGDYQQLNNLTANSNLNGYGINVSGKGQQINNLTANSNEGYGGIYISTSNSNITSLVASENSNGFGVKLITNGNVNMSNVVADNNGTTLLYDGHGIVINGWSSQFNSFTNLTARNNGDHGILGDGFSDSSFTSFEVSGNADRGLELRNALNSSLSDITATANGLDGIYVFRWNQSRLENLYAANNGGWGVGSEQSERLIVNRVSSSNNLNTGYVVSSSESVISTNILATNNSGSGISISEGTANVRSRNILLGATSSNNGNSGFYIGMSYTHLSSLLSLNNGANGISTGSWNEYITFSNLLTANNSGHGIFVSADYGYYTGLLEMGSNGLGDCLVEGVNVPGLIQDGPNANNLTNDCLLNGTSDGILIPSVEASSSVVGKVTLDDLSTTDDDTTPGASSFEGISDWFTFDNAYRSWGIDGSLVFADASNQGQCSVSDNCRIWDWSASTADTGNSGWPAVTNVVALPTATDILSMVWTTSSATDQGYCETNYPGSVWDGSTTCESTYLRNAQEIFADGIGNENGLCESGETCLYMPNIGRYQGHGALVEAGTVGSGVATITLKQYEFIGR